MLLFTLLLFNVPLSNATQAEYESMLNGIHTIKIYGERNSGTTFLQTLLHENLYCDVVSDYHRIVNNRTYIYEWKHGIPELSGPHDNILYIIIFRNLETWLQSFYNIQHHIKRIDGFEKFLTSKLEVKSDPWFDPKTKTHSNHLDEGRNIFELRYHKASAFRNFFDHVPNIIQVNLDYLQQNSEQFVNMIANRFSIVKNKYFKPTSWHLRKHEVFRIEPPKPMTKREAEIIAEHRNDHLEQYIATPVMIKHQLPPH